MPVHVDEWAVQFTRSDVARMREYARDATDYHNQSGHTDHRKDPTERTATEWLDYWTHELLAQWACMHCFGFDFDWSQRFAATDGGVDFWYRGWAIDAKTTKYTHAGAALIVPADCKTLRACDYIVWLTLCAPGTVENPAYRARGWIAIDWLKHKGGDGCGGPIRHRKAPAGNLVYVADPALDYLDDMAKLRDVDANVTVICH